MASDKAGAKTGEVIQAKPPERPALVPLRRGDAKLYELSNNSWVTTAPSWATPEEISMHATFWNLLADDVRAGDQVKVIWQDYSHIALYEIVDCIPGRVFARLAYSAAGAPPVAADEEMQLDPWHTIVRAKAGESVGYYITRRPDQVKNWHTEHRITNNGVSWPTVTDVREAWRRLAINQSNSPTKYFP